ncbi:uncharacterized protein LOC113216314 [Frankliniella occidentalis]|uniref:Uncharacterized protein LOC113216314 n=1 Tax=Frankliniella occidentalis TaxID=133901 RepID=A0A9C6X6T8_FRAOC|nr:uncharacterized protein LOC113216314 [Frankliniella occidentalis]
MLHTAAPSTAAPLDALAVQRRFNEYTLSTRYHQFIGVLTSLNLTDAELELLNLSTPLNGTVLAATCRPNTCYCAGEYGSGQLQNPRFRETYVWLIKALYRANRRKAQLRGYSAVAVLSVQNGSCGGQQVQQMQQLRRPTRAERRTDRTTKMLLAILLLFLITEFPQGILGLLSGILGHSFFSSCYHLFGEVMDILALLNGAINFILYCAMSRQFRTTFGQLFKPRGLMAKLHAVHGPNTSQTEVQSTYV